MLIAFALSIYGCEGKTGPAGPAGPQVPQGGMVPPGDASTIDPNQLGNIPADVHHVLLIQDGDAKDGSAQYLAPMFEMGKTGKNRDTTY